MGYPKIMRNSAQAGGRAVAVKESAPGRAFGQSPALNVLQKFQAARHNQRTFEAIGCPYFCFYCEYFEYCYD